MSFCCIKAAGYGGKMEITNRFSKQKTKGALFIRSSSDPSWGECGNGRLPFDYVPRCLIEAFCNNLKKEWSDKGAFTK